MTPPRREFGFERTTCACATCRNWCRAMPGYLVPADLERLAPAGTLEELLAWARDHLRASPGAIVVKDGMLLRIPTLVPARARERGPCHWLTADDRCSVHAQAPYGCAFVDCRLPRAQGDLISASGLAAIYCDHRDGGRYAQVWQHLHQQGLHALPPEEGRRLMAELTPEETADDPG